jgi:phage terminase large subunit-like protein
LDAIIERSEVIIVGIDGGGLDDLFGLAVLGRDKASKNWLLWSHAWCHHGVLDRRRSIASKLREFEDAGELTIVADQLDDLSAIIAIIARVKDSGLLGSVAVDPAGLGELVDELAQIGVSQEAKTLVGIGQGYRLMNAIKTAERKLAGGTLLHSGSGLMSWCVGNVRIEPTATAIRATKMNAGDAKIDPWAAAMNAIDQMSANPDSAGSIYASDQRPHGLLVL